MTCTLPPFRLEGEPWQEASQTAGAQRRPSAALPCQQGNNSIDDILLKSLLEAWESKEKALGKASAKANTEEQPGENQIWRLVSAYHAKQAFALCFDAAAMCRRHGIERIGFLTLTFADRLDFPAAQKRFNSLATNVLRDRYLEHIKVGERSGSGRLHYHLLVALKEDIRTGFDFEGIAKRDYRTANKAIRSEWAFWRKTAPKYRFGRTEVLPIKTTIDAASCYVGKYIGKHVGMRRKRDKGCRLVSYSVEARKASVRFMFHCSKSRLWRTQLAAFAASRGIERYEQLSERLGKSWAYIFGETIMAFKAPLSGEVGSSKVAPGASSKENFPTSEPEHPESRQDGVSEAGKAVEVQYVYDTRASVYRPVRPEHYKPVLSATLKARLLAAGINPDAVNDGQTKESNELPTKCGAERGCLDTG